MKKGIIIAIILLLIVFTVFGGVSILLHKRGDSKVSNDKAEKDENGRYLTIINDTNQVINEVHITVGLGTEIEHAYQKNPDEKSFSIEIPKQYNEYDTFTVTLVDRYELYYVKDVTGAKAEGRTEVIISEENYVKRDGDIRSKIDKVLNGD